jgi:tripartite-type tricarboxylate transporter receptor subunit TctC
VLVGLAEAQSQSYPNHPVRFIVPYPPGGIIDILARTIAQRISIDWGQQMIVDNRQGNPGRRPLALNEFRPATQMPEYPEH